MVAVDTGKKTTGRGQILGRSSWTTGLRTAIIAIPRLIVAVPDRETLQ
jgi:hypothetical protein